MQRLEAKNPPERPLLSTETGNVENRRQESLQKRPVSDRRRFPQFGKTGWWWMQSSETGLQSGNREFSENFRPKQPFGGLSAVGHWKFACDPNQLHNHQGTFQLFLKAYVGIAPPGYP